VKQQENFFHQGQDQNVELAIARSSVRLPVGRVAITCLLLGLVTVCGQVNHLM